MCLGIPGKIVEIYEANGLRMGRIDFSGVTREACLEYLPEAAIGDYALVHVGFAISLVGEDEALESLRLIREIANLQEEPGDEVRN